MISVRFFVALVLNVVLFFCPHASSAIYTLSLHDALPIFKDTALISLVGLVEIMRAAQLGAASTREPLLFYVCAGALFFVIGVGSQAVFSLAERYAGHGLRTAH